jgi:hypothetical protein
VCEVVWFADIYAQTGQRQRETKREGRERGEEREREREGGRDTEKSVGIDGRREI